MAINIYPATLEDVAEMTNVGLLAFRDDLLNSSIIPLHKATPEQLEEHFAWRTARLRQRMDGPGRYFVKAVEESTGKIVGQSAIFAPEVVNENAQKKGNDLIVPPPVDDAVKTVADTAEGGENPDAAAKAEQAQLPLPSIIEKEVMEKATEVLETAQRDLLGDRTDVWKIPTMAVHPDYHRRGIGKKLLTAVCAHADKAGQDVYLESAPPARKMYADNGFDTLGVQDFAHLLGAPAGEAFELTYMLRRFKLESAIAGAEGGKAAS